MVQSNKENNNSYKIHNKDKENTTKEKVDKFNTGLNILAGIIARDIYNKRKSNSSDK